MSAVQIGAKPLLQMFNLCIHDGQQMTAEMPFFFLHRAEQLCDMSVGVYHP